MKGLKLLFAVALAFFFCKGSLAQVGDIKKEAEKDKKKSEKPFTSGSPEGSSPAAGSGKGCFSGCFSGCFNGCFGSLGLFHITSRLQKDMLARKSKNPAIVSLSVMPQVAYGFSDYLIALPRVRGTWGIFSTDVRMNFLAEIDSLSGDVYKTTDWQILQLNVVATADGMLRLGTGIMYEEFTRRSFPEHFIGGEFYFDDRWTGIAEFRVAKNYSVGSTPRWEFSLRGDKKILSRKHFMGYVSVGGMFQRYYSSVDLWTLQAGFHLMVH
jgi:hypothetical protein